MAFPSGEYRGFRPFGAINMGSPPSAGTRLRLQRGQRRAGNQKDEKPRGASPPRRCFAGAADNQQRLFRPADYPLMQPYAAFNGGELVTIAIQNLIARYLGKPLVNSLTNASHARAERAAKEEVDRGIADYCASRPDRWAILLCNPDR